MGRKETPGQRTDEEPARRRKGSDSILGNAMGSDSTWKVVWKLRLDRRSPSSHLATEACRNLVDDLVSNHLQRETKCVERIRTYHMSHDCVSSSFHSNRAHPQPLLLWYRRPS
jgi:hypothetical protein